MQANLLVSQKIDKELRQRYPAIDREILEIKTGINETLVRFKNQSIIQVCVASENSRGYRASCIIIDESRLVKKSILNEVIRPFLNFVRMPNFLNKPEYYNKRQKYIEENREIYLTSCGYRSEETFSQFMDYKDKMLKGKEYFTCALPYTVALEHGLLTKKRVENIKADPSMSQATWLMEMEAVFYGSNENSLYQIEEINQCRDVKNIFYPPTALQYLTDKKKSWIMKKQDGEIRLIGMDIALMAGNKTNKNDNSVITCMRLLPINGYYERQVVYIETMHGEHAEQQATRLKEIYYEFEADYIALDCMGNGMAVSEYLNKPNYNDEKNLEYPAMTAYNNESMASRTNFNAIPCIFAIKANSEFNHNIAMDLKDKIVSQKIKFPQDDFLAKDRLMENEKFSAKSAEEQSRLLSPYLQCTSLANEMIGLEMSIQNGYVKLKEKANSRKDRFSSLAYVNYLATILERELLKEDYSDDLIKLSELW